MNLEKRSDVARAALRALVPAHYRLLDAAHPRADHDIGPLQALLDLLSEQGAIVEEDVARLYDEWFIETCSDWVIPYIAALIRARTLPSATPDGQRRFVANTLAYRRRKGTARVIEQLARDVTGWSAMATESFRGLALNQSLLHLRLGQGGLADLRNPTRASAAGTPFDPFAHSVDMRRSGAEGARWSIPAIGLFVWRQQPALLQAVEAIPDPGATWLFHADPERRARPWFNWSRSDADVDQLAVEADLAVLLRRRALADELRARRQAAADGMTLPAAYFEGDVIRREPSALMVEMQHSVGGLWHEVPPEAIRVVNLGGSPATIVRPAPAIPAQDGGGGTFVDAAVLVDPMLGRVAIPAGAPIPVALRTSHLLGFGRDIGAGPFDRNAELAATIVTAGGGAAVGWQAGVRKGRASVPAENLFGTLDEAVATWAALPAGPLLGLIVIEDSALHDLGAGLTIPLKTGQALIVAAARWPFDSAQPLVTRFGLYNANGLRPHLAGNLSIKSKGAARIILNGLFQTGSLAIRMGALARFGAQHCTFDVDKPVTVAANPELALQFDDCLIGALALDPLIPEIALATSIVHATGSKAAIVGEGAALTVESCSIFGPVDQVREMSASDSLFSAPVQVRRTQTGCVRFCYLPLTSRTARRFRCQPELAIAKGAPAARVKPHLVSLDRASPWYGQLHPLAHPELREGGEDGGEIGAFRAPSSALAEANIRASIEEYLRLGMIAGALIAT